MPNWCHNKLHVRGKRADVEAFVRAAKPKKDDLKMDWELDKTWVGRSKPPFDDWAEEIISRTPLSFQSLVPFRPDGWPDVETTCDLCNGSGIRPGGKDQFGDEWFKGCGGCNGCGGRGKRVAFGQEGWYRHNCEMWGTKWDASFSEPFMALGPAGANPEKTAAANGVLAGGESEEGWCASYKFDTAWSPPVEFVKNASPKFSSLEFTLEYGEPGAGFAGRTVIANGKVLRDEELSIHDVLEEEDMWF